MKGSGGAWRDCLFHSLKISIFISCVSLCTALSFFSLSVHPLSLSLSAAPSAAPECSR